MYIQLKGNIPQTTLKQLQNSTVYGNKPGGQEDVPIETENFNGNRRPRANDISKYLKDQGGFHWGLYGSPLVARVKSEQGKLYVYDGGHRKAMYEVRFPEATTFPATVIDVENMEEVSRLFHRINGSASKNVNNETRFINQVLGKEDVIKKQLRLLEKTGVVVMESEDNYVPHTNLNPNWKIKARALEDLCRMGENYAIMGLDLYKKSFFSRNNIDEVTGQIAKALAHIFKVEQDYFSTVGYDLFCEWFTSAVKFNPAKNDWLFKTEYPHDRMELRYTGTAFGIWQKFCSYARNNYSGAKVPLINDSNVANTYYEYSEKQQKEKV